MRRGLVAAAVVLLLPASSVAQVLAGTVRDGSGGVMPGVRVQASSPALIEKTRDTVTDGAGRYRLVELPSGVYALTYTLPGFAPVSREGVEVRAGVTVSLDAEMRAGSLAERVVVTGETPAVDMQNSTSVEVILAGETVATLPATRAYGNILAAVPGLQVRGFDAATEPQIAFFTAHGGRGNEGTVRIDGMNVGAGLFGGGVSPFVYDTANAREIQVTVSGGLGETDRGGPQLNIVPKTGGNVFSGTVFGSTAGHWSQGRNLDDELTRAGITTSPDLVTNWDASVSLGGPFVRDRLWFFGSLRSVGEHEEVAGLYANLNAGDPSTWAYARDEATEIRSALDRRIGAIRLTAQLSPRQQLQVHHDHQRSCRGSAFAQGAGHCRDRGDDWIALGFGSIAPESASANDDWSQISQVTWSMPVSRALLLEAGVSTHVSGSVNVVPAGALDAPPFVPVRDTALGLTYHGFAGGQVVDSSHTVWRASVSRVTGTHALKAGYQAAFLTADTFTEYPDHGLFYNARNGVPNNVTVRIAPWQDGNRTRYDGFYVQDEWTRSRLTVQSALRYEHAWSYFPAGKSGLMADSPWGGPAFTLPAGTGARYHDVAPRLGLAYDLFGDGRTAVKVRLGQYWESANNDSVFAIGNPSTTYAETVSRPWTDGNRNFVPDCDLTSPAVQDNRASGGDWCGKWPNEAFGTLASATVVNPDTLRGWGVRPDEWQFGVSLEQEVVPRVSVALGYSRRTWGRFFFTDNRKVGPEDFDVLTITAPTHPRLNSSGQPVSYWLPKPEIVGMADAYYTFAEDFGDVTYYWHGVDLTVDARSRSGLTVQGGVSAGGGVRDVCEVTAALPETWTFEQIDACRLEDKWLMNWRGLASYLVPGVDVQVAAILRSQVTTFASLDLPASNGTSLGASYSISNAEILAALGRTHPGSVFVNLTRPGQLYGDRITLVDLRLAKVLRLGGTRTNVGLDLYNLFNANTVTRVNESFGTDGALWLEPRGILLARFVRFNVTVDF